LFEHIFIVTGDYRAALTLAEYCDKENEEDGYWKVRGVFSFLIESFINLFSWFFKSLDNDKILLKTKKIKIFDSSP